MKTPRKLKPVSIYLSPELYARVLEGAKRDGRSMSSYVYRIMQNKMHIECVWSPIEKGSRVYNTCQPGEEFHLTEGFELNPFCHQCGREIIVETTGD